jgi:hypothetical protein
MEALHPKNIDHLIQVASDEFLYEQLIKQINKDFNFANEALDFPLDVSPEILKNTLTRKIYDLLQYRFDVYLNVLYIIDVPEEIIKNLPGDDLATLAHQVSFLIAKREWQKVWFRNRM